MNNKKTNKPKPRGRPQVSNIRDAAFEARIVAKHSAEDAAIIRNLTGMAHIRITVKREFQLLYIP